MLTQVIVYCFRKYFAAVLWFCFGDNLLGFVVASVYLPCTSFWNCVAIMLFSPSISIILKSYEYRSELVFYSWNGTLKISIGCWRSAALSHLAVVVAMVAIVIRRLPSLHVAGVVWFPPPVLECSHRSRAFKCSTRRWLVLQLVPGDPTFFLTQLFDACDSVSIRWSRSTSHTLSSAGTHFLFFFSFFLSGSGYPQLTIRPVISCDTILPQGFTPLSPSHKLYVDQIFEGNNIRGVEKNQERR